MRPIERSDHFGRRSIVRRIAVGALSILPHVSQLHAHSILMSRGEVLLETDRLGVEIEMSAEDLLHWHPTLRDREGLFKAEAVLAAASQHADVLDEVLVIRDEAGERISCSPFASEFTGPAEGVVGIQQLRQLRPAYRSVCPVSRTNKLITFQIAPANMSIDVFWQLALEVRRVTDGSSTVIRLTSRGNAETVTSDSPQNGRQAAPADPAGQLDDCTSCDDRGTARFKDICADVVLDQGRISADLWIPLPLLSTWISIPVQDAFVSRDAEAQTRETIQALVRNAITITTDKDVKTPELVLTEFVPAVSPREENQILRISFWTGRVHCRLQFSGGADFDRATIRWNLFNNAVLSAHATLRRAGNCVEHEFSTYAPTRDLTAK